MLLGLDSKWWSYHGRTDVIIHYNPSNGELTRYGGNLFKHRIMHDEYSEIDFLTLTFCLSIATTMINDSHLAYLLSLGFDMDLCKQALAQNSSLESATDW